MVGREFIHGQLFLFCKTIIAYNLKRLPPENDLLAATLRLLTMTTNLLAVLFRLLAPIRHLLALYDDLLAERQNYPLLLHLWISRTLRLPSIHLGKDIGRIYSY